MTPEQLDAAVTADGRYQQALHVLRASGRTDMGDLDQLRGILRWDIQQRAMQVAG